MKMSGVKGGLAAIVLGVAAVLNSGCSVGYRDLREKVDCSIVVFPLIGGSADVKHTFYKDLSQTEVECAFDSSISGTLLLGGSVEMKVYGNQREFLWMYRIETAGTKDGIQQYKLRIKDSAGNQSDWHNAVPRYFPSQVNVQMSGSSFSDLSGTTSYSNIKDERVDPRTLLSDEAKAFVKEKLKIK